MTTRPAGRLATTLLLAAALTTAATAPAAATPGGTTTESRLGYATALLYGTDPVGGEGAESLFAAYAPEGVPAFGRGEVFIGGYECTTEESVRARVTGLGSARASGRLHYTCGSADGTVRGWAAVHLRWTGRGPVTEETFDGGGVGCQVHLRVREADVHGRMVVVVPGVGRAVLRLNQDGDADIRQERTVCA